MALLRVLLKTLFLILPLRAGACELALLLAVDVSGSVDTREYRTQMDGLAAALRDGVVSEALLVGRARVAVMQWSGASRQEMSIPWTVITSFDDVETLAERIQSAPRPWRNYSTALGQALAVGVAQFAQVPECRRRIIDVSGDGKSNEGLAPQEMRRSLTDFGITVNAIAIEESEADLTAYFYESVIWGEGAFVVTASSFADYPMQIRRKLIREVAQKTADTGKTPLYTLSQKFNFTK